MKNAPIILKVLYYIIPVLILSCFLSCKREHVQSHRSGTNLPEVREMKNSKAWIFLTYLDSLVKLPAAEFNEAAMMSVHKKYAIELPLVIYDPAKEQNRQDIIIQYYKNNNTSNEVETGIILLIPETITDSLVVGDFTRYFGPITDEQPLIGITEQPRPVRIRVSPDRTIKLTFENNRNRDQAGVTRVEILNYR